MFLFMDVGVRSSGCFCDGSCRRGSTVADGEGVNGKGLHELTTYRSSILVVTKL